MKRLSKLLLVLSIVALLLPTVAVAKKPVPPAKPPDPPTCEVEKCTELTAGGGSPSGAVTVGTVCVTQDGGNLIVEYQITAAGWVIIGTHLHVATALEDIPVTKKDSPKIGTFEHQTTHDPGVDYVVHTIPLPDGAKKNDTLYIAAHAVVNDDNCSVEELCADLLEVGEVHLVVTGVPPGPDSLFYLPELAISNSGLSFLDKTHGGWCADQDGDIWLNDDPDHPLWYEEYFTAQVYGSYCDNLPEDLFVDDNDTPLDLGDDVDYAPNLDLVNWILNNVAVGDETEDCEEIEYDGKTYAGYTYGDIQGAIWYLLSGDMMGTEQDPWDPCRVYEIVADAEEFGEEFVPGCGQVMAVVLQPSSAVFPDWLMQLVIIPIPVPCCDETAWGGPYPNCRFNDSDWSIYFTYEVQEP